MTFSEKAEALFATFVTNGTFVTPMEALQVATRNAADYLSEADWGGGSRSKPADPVLPGANPLTAIQNTRRISAMLRNGNADELISDPVE